MNAILTITHIEYRLERLALGGLVLSVLCLSGLYFYFLSASVIHVVMTEELAEKANQAQGEIAALEAAYMDKQHAISLEVVERRGYIASVEKIFIDRGEDSVVTKR